LSSVSARLRKVELRWSFRFVRTRSRVVVLNFEVGLEQLHGPLVHFFILVFLELLQLVGAMSSSINAK